MVSVRHILFLLVQKRKTILIHTVHIYPQEQINFQFYFHLKEQLKYLMMILIKS